MRTLKPIWRLLVLLVISVSVAVPIATNCYGQDKSESPSPVKTSALALLDELEAPNMTCGSDDTICISRVTNAKLTAAIAGLRSIIRIDEQRTGIVADMQKRIDIRGGIIDDLQKVDRNSQRIDMLGVGNLAVMREQHIDDKRTIGDLQVELKSCQANQKWIALVSGVGGGFIGYKIRGAGQFQNPFVPQSTSTFQLVETQAEKMLRERLRLIRELR